MSATAYPEHRTYLRRRGRMTPAQARALEELSAERCLNWPVNQTPSQVFGREAPLGVEIGFGMGQALVDWAMRAPDWNLIGIDVYLPGVGAALIQAEQSQVQNLRIIKEPAELVFDQWLPLASIDEVRIFYPDPWPKKRHHKRRLIQPAFVQMLIRRLKPGGRLWLATDWAPYAQWMQDVVEAAPELNNYHGANESAPPSGDRPMTRFQARGNRLGHQSVDLLYYRKA